MPWSPMPFSYRVKMVLCYTARQRNATGGEQVDHSKTNRGVFVRIPAEDYERMRQIAVQYERSINFVAKRLMLHGLRDSAEWERALR